MGNTQSPLHTDGSTGLQPPSSSSIRSDRTQSGSPKAKDASKRSFRILRTSFGSRASDRGDRSGGLMSLRESAPAAAALGTAVSDLPSGSSSLGSLGTSSPRGGSPASSLADGAASTVSSSNDSGSCSGGASALSIGGSAVFSNGGDRSPQSKARAQQLPLLQQQQQRQSAGAAAAASACLSIRNDTPVTWAVKVGGAVGQVTDALQHVRGQGMSPGWAAQAAVGAGMDELCAQIAAYTEGVLLKPGEVVEFLVPHRAWSCLLSRPARVDETSVFLDTVCMDLVWPGKEHSIKHWIANTRGLKHMRVQVGTKEYALQPGEHDALLEAQWGLTRGTLRKMNRGLTVGAPPYNCRLKVPWHVRV